MKYFQDDSVSPTLVKLEDGSIIVTEFKDSYIHRFDKNGKLMWIDSVGENGNIYSLAYQNNYLWCVYPNSNELKKFSLDSFREEHQSGSLTNGIFNYPEFAIVYGEMLYVCDMGNCRICDIDLDSYEVSEYLKFNEPTWEYFRIYGKEVVRLESGIYIL